MLDSTVLTTAMVKPVAVAVVGVVLVVLVLAAAFAVRMRGRRAAQPGEGYAGGPGADGGSADQAATESPTQDRWRRLAGDHETDLDAEIDTSQTTNAPSSAPPSVAAPDRGKRVEKDATHPFGLEPASAAWAPAQTRSFGLDEGVCNTPLLDDDQAVADHSADGPTGDLLALPPAAQRAAPGGADGRPASRGLDGVRERLSAVSTPQVVALSVIDSAGHVLAGATDEDVAGELHALVAESGLGQTADLVQLMRFADDSRGAMLVLPTGANALLGALVCDADDLQATRARLRILAHEIGDAMRAAS